MMTVLIAIPVATFYAFTSQRATLVADWSTVALKVFAVWTLSFLPGWLYVRFLGQRAGALWSEYVQNLHRLGLDSPQFLPKPPENSEYLTEWLQAGGLDQVQKDNLYRQKFNAYYGRSVSAASEMRTNFAVTAETMFPVYLTTIILSTAFTTLFVQTSFANTPHTVWDMVKFGFLGAYVFIAQSLTRRFFASDLRPSAYASAILRIVVVLIVVIALHQVLEPTHNANAEAVVAFVIGIFPVIAFQALSRAAAATLRVAVPQLTPDYPLNQLDGLNIWYESRLVEEGIEDMENLATANLVDVILHTRVPVGRLVDWVDQAHLYLHLDRVERGGKERRRAAKALPVQPATTQDGDGSSPAIVDVTSGSTSIQTVPPRTEGSVVAGSRAGTRTRIALRQLGIRNATDLLKAFPPDQIDPRDASTPQRAFNRLKVAGVDPDQIRLLVRVLDEDTGLAPVWNWQTRGAVARPSYRRPRSLNLTDPAPSSVREPADH